MDQVTVAPEVIRTVVRNTVLAMPSVRGLVNPRVARERGLERGVAVSVKDGSVSVSLHVIAAQDVPLLELGQQIQIEVKNVVEEVIGLSVAKVDVSFEDVTT
ncbi:MAG: Asp23/Gls24 family envelope stress response protein [Anaerolineae bacterium]|nr:Asp23/Gls24 family envelope stress response protein [Thermoflexales bacterium]MDW8395594.1 Asp23/Gls24 family envelope stress response protein [Anaerolineae bacterium]